ncbi:MAG: tyrosine-type recombinase/integrase [Rhodobacterales bacterium]
MKQALTLTDQQYKQVIAFCSTRKHTLRDQTIVHISFLAGLRAIEIAGLRIGDVYDDTGSVRAQFSISGKQTKGGDARTIYVSRKLRRVLEQYHAVIADRSSSAPLFQTQLCSSFSANTMCQLFLQVYKDCGLKGASSHSGRRTFITKLANTGINVRLLAALAGHSDISTTQRYIDVNDTQLANAVELI